MHNIYIFVLIEPNKVLTRLYHLWQVSAMLQNILEGTEDCGNLKYIKSFTITSVTLIQFMCTSTILSAVNESIWFTTYLCFNE